MGDRLGIPRVVDSSLSLLIEFFFHATRAPALEQRNHLLFCFFLRSSASNFTQLYRFSAYCQSDRSQLCFSQPPFLLVSALRVYYEFFFELSISVELFSGWCR